MATQDFINKCKQPAYKDRFANFTLGDTIVSSNNYIESIEITESIVDNKSIVGSCNTKTAKVGLIGYPKDEVLDGVSFNPTIGINQGDYNESISYDSFVITKINDGQTENTTDFEAEDSLNLAGNKYVCGIDYNDGNTHTVQDLWLDVCSQLDLVPYSNTFTNYNIPISANPFTNNETIREVLQEICRVSLSFVVIDRETGKIRLSWLSTNTDPDYIFETSDYTELSGSLTKTGPINSLILGNSQTTGENVSTQDDTSIEENGEHQLYIDAKYILYNEELRLMAIQDIWEKVNGLEYYDLKLTTPLGKPFLNLGDKIRVITNEEDTYDTYLLKHTFTYNGTFASVIESPSMTSQEEKMKNSTKSITEKTRDTELIVNKQAGTIEEIIREADDTNERLSYAIRDINSLRNIFQITGGHNCIRNSAFLLPDPVWTFENDIQSAIFPLKGKIEQNKLSGKQLFNKNQSPASGYEGYSVDVLDTGVKLIYTSSTQQDWAFCNWVLFDLTNYTGKTIRFKTNFTNNGGRGRYIIGRSNSNASSRITMTGNAETSGTLLSFVVPTIPDDDDRKYLCIWLYANTQGSISQGSYVEYKDVILTVNNADMSYEPYCGGIASPNPDYPQEIHTITGINTISIAGKSYIIDLGNIELCDIDGYQDYFYRETGDWYLHKEVGKEIFNENSNWSILAVSTNKKMFKCSVSNSYAVDLVGVNNANKYFATNYGITGYQTLDNGNIGATVAYGFRANSATVNANAGATVAQWQQYVAQNNITLYGRLRTPTNTKITDTTLINQLNEIYDNQMYHTNLGEGYSSSMIGSIKSESEIKLQNVIAKTTIDNITNLTLNTQYVLNFYFKQDRSTTSKIKLYDTYNDSIVVLDEVICETTSSVQGLTHKSYTITANSSNYTLEIETYTTNQEQGMFYLYDLMLNSGDEQTWEPSSDEIYSTTLRMSREGLRVYSTGARTLTMLTSDGFLIFKTTNGETLNGLVQKTTADGTIEDNLKTKRVKFVKDISDTTKGWIEENMYINGKEHLIRYYGEEND